MHKKSEAIKELEKLAYQHKLKCTTMPAYAVVRPKFSDRTANGLQAAVIAYIDLLKGWAVRVNTQGRFLHEKPKKDILGNIRNIKGRWIPGSGKVGTPDIIGSLHGRFIGVEVKIGTDRQTEKQRAVESEILLSGGAFIVARDFAGFKDKLESFFSLIKSK